MMRLSIKFFRRALKWMKGILETRTALAILGMGIELWSVQYGSLASDRGIGLVKPEPMARKMRNVTGKPISTVQFPKGQTEGQMPVEF